MKRLPLSIIVLGVILSLFALIPSFNNPFRSDDWYIASLSFNQPLNFEGIKKSLTFELFGDPRFQPLSHLLVFFTHKLFGSNFFLYHIFSFALHLIVTGLFFYLIKFVIDDSFISSIISVLFLALFCHSDTFIWAYHNYIIVQTALIITALILTFKGLKNNKILYAVLPSILFFIGMICYEAILFFPLLIIILIADKFRSSSCEARKFAFASAFSTLVFYLIWAVLVIKFAASPFTNQQIDSFYRFIIEIVVGISIMFTGFLRMCVHSVLVCPPDYILEDIPYLVMSKFSILGIIFSLGIFAYFIILPKKCEKRNRLLIFLILSLLSYIFVISFGRKCFYANIQSRYFYFPNLLLLLIVSIFLKDIFSFSIPRWNGFNRKDIMIFSKNSIILAYLTAQILINVFWNYGYCRNLKNLFDPISANIKEIRDAYDNYSNSGNFKLFVDFVPANNDNKIFLGTHIALETVFYNQDILTRDIGKANFIYTLKDGIRPNPYYLKASAEKSDFTISFDIERIRYMPEIYIVKSEDYFIKLLVTEKGQEKIMFGGMFNKGLSRNYLEFEAYLIPESLSRIVLQKQGSYIFITQNGRLLLKEAIEEYDIEIKDRDLFIGAKDMFPSQYTFIENFYAMNGMAKYNLANYNVNDNVMLAGLRSPLVVIGSRPYYWMKGLKNLYANSK